MTYVLMRVLESAPSHYDKGIRLLTRGGVDAAYDFLAAQVSAGQRVLDIGCGTAALTLRAPAGARGWWASTSTPRCWPSPGRRWIGWAWAIGSSCGSWAWPNWIASRTRGSMR